MPHLKTTADAARHVASAASQPGTVRHLSPFAKATLRSQLSVSDDLYDSIRRPARERRPKYVFLSMTRIVAAIKAAIISKPRTGGLQRVRAGTSRHP